MDTKALRQKILDLAIHGKLVPQDSNDEPASVLLERIRAEKERLIKEGKIKKGKKSAKTSDKPHYPFELPKGWVWTTVDEIYFVTKLAGFEYTEHFTKEAISPMNAVPIVRAQNVKMGRFIENRNEAITIELSEQLSRSALYKDCLLMTFIGAGIGETCIFHANKRNHLAPNVAKIEPFDENINMEYALFFFMSSLGQQGVTNISKSTAQASLSMATIRELVIPIPPIKEQSRIAKEVVKWFSLIECIEENTGNLQETIKQTKSKILDLAIHGKLVPQDPNDEPASELLKRINPKAEITCDTPQYGKLPKGWCLCKISSVVDIVNGKSQKNVESPTGKYPIYGSGGVIGKAMEYTCLAGSTIIGRKGTINHPIFVEENFWNVDTAFGMKANNQILEDKYFYCFCLYFDFSKLDKSSALPSLTKTAIGNLIFPIPPLAEQQRIVAKIEELFSQLDKIESSLQA